MPRSAAAHEAVAEARLYALDADPSADLGAKELAPRLQEIKEAFERSLSLEGAAVGARSRPYIYVCML